MPESDSCLGDWNDRVLVAGYSRQGPHAGVHPQQPNGHHVHGPGHGLGQTKELTLQSRSGIWRQQPCLML